ELGRRRLRHGQRAGGREDPRRPAAPGPGPEEDVDAGPPAPDAAAAEPQRAAQRDDPRGAAGVPRRLHPRWARRASGTCTELSPDREGNGGGGAATGRRAASSALPHRTAEGTMAD